MVGAKDLASLPKAVEGCYDGTREEVVQDWLHDLWDLRLRQGRLVAQVGELPGPGKRGLILETKVD